MREGSIFARWNIGTRCGGRTLVFLGCLSLQTEGVSTSSVGSSLCGTQATRKNGGEEGRASGYFGSLDRWTRSIRSFVVLVGSCVLVSALNCVLMDVPNSCCNRSRVRRRSNSPVDTSQLLS